MKPLAAAGFLLTEWLGSCSEGRVGGMLGGKCGLLWCRMGSGADGFAPLREALAASDLPISQLLPTHAERPMLLADCRAWLRAGGNVDFTAGVEAGAASSAIQHPPLEPISCLAACQLNSSQYRPSCCMTAECIGRKWASLGFARDDCPVLCSLVCTGGSRASEARSAIQHIETHPGSACKLRALSVAFCSLMQSGFQTPRASREVQAIKLCFPSCAMPPARCS